MKNLRLGVILLLVMGLSLTGIGSKVAMLQAGELQGQIILAAGPNKIATSDTEKLEATLAHLQKQLEQLQTNAPANNEKKVKNQNNIARIQAEIAQVQQQLNGISPSPSQ